MESCQPIKRLKDKKKMKKKIRNMRQFEVSAGQRPNLSIACSENRAFKVQVAKTLE
jgi:hypothetical protein